MVDMVDYPIALPPQTSAASGASAHSLSPKVLNGELRGCGWVTLPVPRLGRKANSGCYKLLGPDRGLGKRLGLWLVNGGFFTFFTW